MILCLIYFQHEKLSTLVFEHHIYRKEESLFRNHGISTDDVEFIKELIDHDLVDLKKPERRFLYEVYIDIRTIIRVIKTADPDITFIIFRSIESSIYTII